MERIIKRSADGELKGLTVNGKPLSKYLEETVTEVLEPDKHAIKKSRKVHYLDKKDKASGLTEWTRGQINRKRNKELMKMARDKSLTEMAFTALLSGEELSTIEIREKMEKVAPDRRISKDHVSNIMYHMNRRPDVKRLLIVGKRGKGKSYQLLSSVVEHCTAQDLMDLHDKRSKATLASLCKAYPAIEQELKAGKVKEPTEKKEMVPKVETVPESEIIMQVQKMVDERIEAFKKDLSAHGIEIKVSGGIEFIFKLG